MRAPFRRSGRLEQSDGFTLLEVVVAMGLLAGGLLAIAAAQLSALHLSSKSKNLTIAMNLAQQKLEEFQATAAASLPATGTDPGNPIDPDPADTDLTAFNRSWVVQANTPSADVTTLSVSVDWVEPKTGVTRTTTLQSMKAQ